MAGIFDSAYEAALSTPGASAAPTGGGIFDSAYEAAQVEVDKAKRQDELARVRDEAAQQTGSGLSKEFRSGFYGTVGSAAKGVGALVGSQTVEDYGDETNAYAQGLSEGSGMTQSLYDIEDVGDAVSYAGKTIANAAGSTIPTLVGGGGAGALAARGLGAAASRGAVGGAFGVSAAAGTGQNIVAQEDQVGERDLLSAATLGAAGGALEVAGGLTGGALKALAGKGAKRGVLRQAGRSAVEEAGVETGQQFTEELSRRAVDENFDVLGSESRGRLLEAGVAGAIGGGALGGGISAITREKKNAVPSADPEAAGTDPTVSAEADAKGEPLQITGPRAEPARIEDQRNWQREEKTTEPIVAGAPRGTPARQEVLDIFTGATPETLRPTSEGEVIRAVRADLPLDATLRQITTELLTALNGGKAKGKKASVLPVTDRVAAAYEMLDTLADKLAASPNIKPEKQESYLAALARAAEVVQAYELNLEALGVPRVSNAPTVEQMAGPGVPIEQPGQINAAQAGFNSMVRPSEDIGQQTVDANIAQQNMMAQQQAEQQRAAELGMLEEALPAAEQLAATVEEQQALQQEDNLRIANEQLQPAQRQELLDSIINGPSPQATPLRAFMQGLRKIDPNLQPSPEELSALAQYSSMSYADKAAQAEKAKPEKLVPKAPQNEALLEPVSVPKKLSKRQQRVQQARAEATALVPESQQSPELKSMLQALEDTARSVDNVFKSLLKAEPIVGEQQSLFEGSDPRVQPSQPKGFRQYVQNKIAAQDAKFEKQLADLKAVVEAQAAPAPTPVQAELFDAKGKPTKAAQRLTKDQVAEQIATMEKSIPNDGLGAAKKLAVVPEIKALVETAPGEAVVDLMSAVSRPDVSMQDAVQLTQIVKDRYAPAPTPAAPRETTEALPAPEEEAESAALDEENPGVNPMDAALMPLSPAARVRARERGLGDALKMWTAGWKNAPEIVLFDPNNPSDPRAAEFYKFAPFAGLYDRETKKVFMNIYAFENATEFGGTLYHEALGHYGLDQLYGKRRREVLMQIYRGNPEVRREAAALQKQSGVSVGTDIENQLYYTEEVLVNRFNNGNLELSPTFWQKIRDLITEFARKMGMPARKYTNAELIATLHAARDTVINGRPPTAPGPTRPTFGQRFAAQPLAPTRQPIGQEIVDAFSSSDALNKYMLSKGIVNPAARRVAITARDYIQKSRLTTMMGNTFADLAEKLGLTDFARLNAIKQERAALLNEKRNEIENLIVEANRLNNREALQSFMKDYTTKGKHGFVPDFYTAADKAEVTVDPAARARVEKFKQENSVEHAVMLKLMKFAYDERTQYQDAIDKYINGEADEALTEKGLTKQEIAEIQSRRARQLKMFKAAVPKLDGPYFPLSRFGENMVVAESPAFVALQKKDKRTAAENAQLEAMESDPKHYQVHFFDSKGEAELMRADIAAQPEFSGAGARVTNAVKTQFFEQMGESPLLQMQKLRQMVQKDLPDTTFDRDTKRQIDTLLSDLYVRSLAETSARKFDARRKNVAGASDEMLRAFHDKMKADAASRAHVTTFAQEMAIQKTLYDQVNKNPTDPQYEARRDFLRELQFRNDQQLNLDMRQSELSNRVMLASSVYHLFTMPRYYIQNLLQPGVYTAPKIAARHTIGKTLSTMSDVYGKMKDAALTKEFWSGEINVDKLALPDNERAFLKAAQQQGKLEFGQQLDFGEWNSDTKVGRGTRWAVHKMRTVSGQVEFINRTVSGVTAYRLELARTGNVKAATDYALRMIDDTQLNYATTAQSRLFNMLPKVVTQFRKYQVGMLALQYGMIKDALGAARKDGLSSAEFKEAATALAYSWGTIGAVAGTMGLPGMQIIAVMGAYMFGEDDEPLNGERWVRGKFSDDQMGLALRKGLPAMMGLDMGNVGLGTILNPLPFFDYSKLGERGGGLEMLGALAGPAAGAATGILEKGYQEGLAAGAEQALPSGFRAMIKAYGMATEGLERKNGDIIMTPDEIGSMKAVLQALGFRDLDAAEKMTRYYETVAAEEYYRDRVSEMKREFAEAQDDNNADAQREIISQWRKMNEAKKRFDLKPTAVSELYKARTQRAERVKKFRERAQIE